MHRLFVCAGFLVKKLFLDTGSTPDLRGKTCEDGEFQGIPSLQLGRLIGTTIRILPVRTCGLQRLASRSGAVRGIVSRIQEEFKGRGATYRNSAQPLSNHLIRPWKTDVCSRFLTAERWSPSCP